MNILICCSAGMSSGILVREMRDIICREGLDYKLAAISVNQIQRFIDKADVVFVAPQNTAEYRNIYEMGRLRNIPVYLIGREEYGMMNGKKVIEIITNRKNQYQSKELEVVELDNFSQALESRLLPFMNGISTQRHLSAVRDGLIATIPLSVIGAIAILIPYLPWPQAYVDFMGSNPELVSKIMILFSMSVGMMSVFASFGIGLSLANSYGMDGLSGGVTALFSFLATMSFTSTPDGSFLSTAYLGGEGTFTAILTSLLAVEIMRFCVKKDITIKLPKSVPANVGNSFSSLIPVFFSVIVVWVIVHILGVDINSLISSVITPILSMSSNSIAAPLVYVLLTAIMWFFGMHPAVLASIMTPIWTINANANMAAAAAGQAIPNVGVQCFIFTFLWIGGGGGTLALCLMMCFSKSKTLKSLGRLSIVPGFFNINEPIIFGLPIVFNPVLIIPFTVGPVICTIVTYLAFTAGFVPGLGYPTAAVWTMPSIFAGVIATASVRAAILVIVNLLIYAAIYYPFFKIYEKKYVLQELEGANA